MESCKALSLSGGGAKGAYEVGALWQMTRSLNASELEYDVVSGISVGSINAAGLALFERGKEAEAMDYLKNLWETMGSEQVWKYWDGFEPYQALFKHSGILDNSPLKATLDQVFGEKDF